VRLRAERYVACVAVRDWSLPSGNNLLYGQNSSILCESQ